MTLRLIEICRDDCPALIVVALPCWLSGKEYACQYRRHRLICWIGKIPWRRKGNPHQYSCLVNLIDRGTWWATCPAAAAAAAKSLQSCPTLCESIEGSPPGSPVPGIFQAKTLEWVAISFSNAAHNSKMRCLWIFSWTSPIYFRSASVFNFSVLFIFLWFLNSSPLQGLWI